jgi:DNA-3-methyladenine glycosylase
VGGAVARSFPREVLAAETLAAARALLGARLVRDALPGLAARRVGRIVEVEAYLGLDDRASHARMGPTDRNRVMFGPPGIAYVYLVYGMHCCLNVVTEASARPAALLVRAVEPVEGADVMRVARAVAGARRRSAATGERVPRRIQDARIAAGPGLVAAAFGIDRTHTGLDLCEPASPLRLEARPSDEPAPEIAATPRIGIAYAPEPWASVPWRFIVAASASLSRRP